MMSLPGIDPDPQFFGNQDKLLSSGPVYTGTRSRSRRRTRFSLRSFPDSMQVSEMEKNSDCTGIRRRRFQNSFNHPEME
jgi:hypothetical protein